MNPVKQPNIPFAPHPENTAAAIEKDFIRNLFTRQAKFSAVATRNDLYLALAWTVRDRLLDRWIDTASTYFAQASRTVCYLSAEFLMGPQLQNNLLALGIEAPVRQAMERLGINLEELIEHEEEPGLGNGGLGRLAACFMDSLATLELPAIGYGLRYEFGIFDQAIKDGWQVENSDTWLRYGYPWEVARSDIEVPVGFGGTTHHERDELGRLRVMWHPEERVIGVPYDTPVPGYGVRNCNFLRLWAAVAPQSFDFAAFNTGNYLRAVEQKIASENITKVLYPNDQDESGRILRLKQQYLLVSCTLRDMIRLFLQREPDLKKFSAKFAVQLNDTHPALAVAELMRLLVDLHHMTWEDAWEVTHNTFGYTNHTLMPEALEAWSLPMFARILPRHLEIIYEINHRFLAEVRRTFPGDDARIGRMSLIDERGTKRVRMANLATVGSHTVNGVAALHSDLLQKTVLQDFAALWPKKFTNVTNGVTPRRFMAVCNPGLSRLITGAIGEGWLRDLEQLQKLEPLANDAGFRAEFARVKLQNKQTLQGYLDKKALPSIHPSAMLDVQAKRFHAYKRQLLAVLHVIARWRRMQMGEKDGVPRTVLFAGKAAPGYAFAKKVIRLIHGVADVVNNTKSTRDRLRVVFVPDFNVKNGQWIYPAADLSEQISTAGMEASGTGNMKFALNGALTIGTLDGANIEMRDAVGPENFFLFGLTTPDVTRFKQSGYQPREIIQKDQQLEEVLALIDRGTFSDGDRGLFSDIVESVVEEDPYMVAADFRAYVQCQATVDRAFEDQDTWVRTAILNVARMGRFSSDRAIGEYATRIWKVDRVSIPVSGSVR